MKTGYIRYGLAGLMLREDCDKVLDGPGTRHIPDQYKPRVLFTDMALLILYTEMVYFEKSYKRFIVLVNVHDFAVW